MLIELKGIARSYRVGKVLVEALRGVDLTVAPGEFVSVMGPSGCGKSTLLNIIGCLDRPTAGTYRLAGQAVEGLPDGRLAEIRNRMIGFVFQSFHLIEHLDAWGNVEMPLIYRGMAARERRRRVDWTSTVGEHTNRRKSLEPQRFSGQEGMTDV